MQKITPQQLDDMRDRYSKGLASLSSLSRETGVHINTVRDYVKNGKTPHYFKTMDRDNEILSMYDRGISTTVIAEKFEISDDMVRYVAQYNGREPRARGGYRESTVKRPSTEALSSDWTTTLMEKNPQSVDEFNGLAKVEAEKYDVHVGSFIRWIRQANLPASYREYVKNR